jgi:hypothetical protein
LLPDAPRQPIKAKLTDSPGERRLERLQPRPCSACGYAVARVMLRTDYVIYFRCDRCSAMWSMPKPGMAAFGT